MSEDVRVVDAPERSQYEAFVAAEQVGLAAYVARGEHRTVTHTEVDPAWEGHGIGGAIVRGVLADLRERGLTLTPQCPFFAAHLERHPEERDLVADPPT